MAADVLRAGAGDEQHAAAMGLGLTAEILILVIEKEALVEAADGKQELTAHEHRRAPDVVDAQGAPGGAFHGAGRQARGEPVVTPEPGQLEGEPVPHGGEATSAAGGRPVGAFQHGSGCLLYTSDAADE